jgi:hypothetical protein
MADDASTGGDVGAAGQHVRLERHQHFALQRGESVGGGGQGGELRGWFCIRRCTEMPREPEPSLHLSSFRERLARLSEIQGACSSTVRRVA